MKDNFSAGSDKYARYRPDYPQQLFDFLLNYVPGRNLAWDCGTGNGQTAAVLSRYFKKVYANDISSKQLSNAIIKDNILYVQEPAEHTTVQPGTVDLVCISQSLHWFDTDTFYAEVKRVAAPEGIIAAWTYNLIQVDKATDALIHDLHFNIIGKYWDKERAHVIAGYSTLPFPFTIIDAPDFTIELNWTPEDLEGYLDTWSGLHKFIQAEKYNPLKQVMEKIHRNWTPGETKPVKFPLQLKAGYIHK